MTRDEIQVLLNKEQAKKFARAILADIVDYAESHQEELEQLRLEKNKKEEL